MCQPAHLLEHHPHLDHAQTRPAVLLGGQQTCCPQTGEAFPDRHGGTPAVVELVTDIGPQRRPIDQETPHRGPQLLLLSGKLEVHRALPGQRVSTRGRRPQFAGAGRYSRSTSPSQPRGGGANRPYCSGTLASSRSLSACWASSGASWLR